MPRTMFTEVVSPRASSGRNWYTIPLSLLVHGPILCFSSSLRFWRLVKYHARASDAVLHRG
jgi:hypothetical protein